MASSGRSASQGILRCGASGRRGVALDHPPLLSISDHRINYDHADWVTYCDHRFAPALALSPSPESGDRRGISKLLAPDAGDELGARAGAVMVLRLSLAPAYRCFVRSKVGGDFRENLPARARMEIVAIIAEARFCKGR